MCYSRLEFCTVIIQRLGTKQLVNHSLSIWILWEESRYLYVNIDYRLIVSYVLLVSTVSSQAPLSVNLDCHIATSQPGVKPIWSVRTAIAAIEISKYPLRFTLFPSISGRRVFPVISANLRSPQSPAIVRFHSQLCLHWRVSVCDWLCSVISQISSPNMVRRYIYSWFNDGRCA